LHSQDKALRAVGGGSSNSTAALEEDVQRPFAAVTHQEVAHDLVALMDVRRSRMIWVVADTGGDHLHTKVRRHRCCHCIASTLALAILT
jgi:hypothetical protein